MGAIGPLRRKVREKVASFGYPLPPFVIAELAQEFGESPNTVRIIMEADMEGFHKCTWEPWEVAYLRSHLHLSDRQIAEKLKRTTESVRGKRVNLGMPKRHG